MRWNRINKLFGSIYNAIAILVMLIVMIGAMIFVCNDYSLYTSPIAKITDVEETYSMTATGLKGEEENIYNQTITLQVLNGTYKGDTFSTTNSYAESEVRDIRYQKGDKVFLYISEDEQTVNISGVKRDQYLVLMCLIAVFGLLLVAGRQGVATILSLAANIAIFVYMMKRYVGGEDIGTIGVIMVLAFSAITMFLLGGISKKSIGSLVAILLSEAAVYVLYQFVLKFVEMPPYEMMDYIVGMEDLSEIYTLGIVMGCLGAVMDVAITINAAVCELVAATESITLKELIASIKAISHDIMGTMINVMLFAYITGSFPIALIKIANGFSLSVMVRFNLVFEITRFLTGAIGIVLAIPIAGAVAIAMQRRVLSDDVNRA